MVGRRSGEGIGVEESRGEQKDGVEGRGEGGADGEGKLEEG